MINIFFFYFWYRQNTLRSREVDNQLVPVVAMTAYKDVVVATANAKLKTKELAVK